MRQTIVLITLAVLVLNGCGGPAPSSSTGEPTQETQKGRTFAVIPKGLVHQFWLTVKAGAEKAGEENGVDIIWIGPQKETEVVKQINIVEDMIGRGVDAIVMAACDQEALVDVLGRAVEAGIPVVTIDSGVASDLPVTFVATDNVAGAATAGEALAKLIGEEGEVAVIPFVKGAATSEMREEGFRQGIADYPNVKLVAVQYSQSDVAKAMDVTEDILTAHPNLKGIFAANEAGALGAVQALEAAGKAGEIKLVGFDASDGEIAALENGTIQALIVQSPFNMGYLGVKAAAEHLDGKPVEKRIDTGVTVVTKDNLNDPEIQKLLNPL